MVLLSIARQAASICRGVADQPALLESSNLEIANFLRVGDMQVALTLSVLVELEWIKEESGGQRRLLDSSQLLRLADKLDGAADFQSSTQLPPTPEIILTQPPEPSLLVRALSEMNAPSTYWTRDGFVHLARQASSSLRVVAPFIDRVGSDLLERMFSCTEAKSRLLVLRPTSRGERPWKVHVPSILRLGVNVREYWHESTTDGGRRRIETFHAKMILADDRIAYVGSSNFLTSSLDQSLECGVLLSGIEVSVVTALIDAIERISQPIASA
jgi:hypothetical protein